MKPIILRNHFFGDHIGFSALRSARAVRHCWELGVILKCPQRYLAAVRERMRDYALDAVRLAKEEAAKESAK